MTQKWPAWRYSPIGEAEVFEREGDVPAGWSDRPAKGYHPHDIAAGIKPDPVPWRRARKLTLKPKG